MTPASPPPLPLAVRTSRRDKIALRLLVAAGALPILFICVFLGLRVCGLVRVFSTPAGSMAPAIEAGDQVVMTNFTKARRGDIIVFRTDDIPLLNASGGPGQIYVKRLVGLPGEKLQLTNGMLFVNGERVEVENKNGPIRYSHPRGSATYLTDNKEIVEVPPDACFVLGDNTNNSLDGRYWGFVPMKSVLGRATYCYAPSAHRGSLK